MHKVIIPGYKLPNPMRGEEESSFLNKLRKRVGRSLSSGNQEQAFLGELYNLFEEHEDIGLHLKYCGFYEIDPRNSKRTNPRDYNIGIGCREIPVWKGVIASTIRLYAKSMYVTSVYALEQADPNAHWACDSTMKGAEIVINQPYTYKTGRKKGLTTSRMMLDLDIERENPFSDVGAGCLEEVCIPAMKVIFPGPPPYSPITMLHMPKPEKRRSREYCPVH